MLWQNLRRDEGLFRGLIQDWLDVIRLSGNMDLNLRFPGGIILTHTHIFLFVCVCVCVLRVPFSVLPREPSRTFVGFSPPHLDTPIRLNGIRMHQDPVDTVVFVMLRALS